MDDQRGVVDGAGDDGGSSISIDVVDIKAWRC